MEPRKRLTARPVVILILCALCIYGTLLALLLGLGAQDKVGFFVASGLSLFAAHRLFQHFLRLKGRPNPHS